MRQVGHGSQAAYLQSLGDDLDLCLSVFAVDAGASSMRDAPKGIKGGRIHAGARIHNTPTAEFYPVGMVDNTHSCDA